MFWEWTLSYLHTIMLTVTANRNSVIGMLYHGNMAAYRQSQTDWVTNSFIMHIFLLQRTGKERGGDVVEHNLNKKIPLPQLFSYGHVSDCRQYTCYNKASLQMSGCQHLILNFLCQYIHLFIAHAPSQQNWVLHAWHEFLIKYSHQHNTEMQLMET